MPEWLGIVLWIATGLAAVLGVFAVVGFLRFIVMSAYNKDF